MIQKYDLTNQSELKEIITTYVFSDPVLALGKYVFDKIFSTDTFALQKETAEKLIQRGKENGVSEMEITIDNKRGFKLNVPVEGVQIDTRLGADEKMHVKVKYK